MKHTLEELTKKHNIYPEYRDFYLSFELDKKLNDWVFQGYRCTKCGKLFKKDKTVPSHYTNCLEINRVKVYKTHEIDESATVLNKYGVEWEPYDGN